MTADNNSWFDTTNDGPQTNFLFAITISISLVHFRGVVSVLADTGDPEVHPFISITGTLLIDVGGDEPARSGHVPAPKIQGPRFSGATRMTKLTSMLVLVWLPQVNRRWRRR